MVLWVVVFLVLVLAGLGVIAWFSWRLFGDVRHFGSTVADASTRLSDAAAELERASGPASGHRPGPVPGPRTASTQRH
ncbi:hypothetical protein [Streptomyces sp. SID3343]|uniref:hypothetical protein n=1 Tax=Streptomyces sp. SID3343 TaxID=2690260 RepID=UPI00136DE9CB|nr:hypothetical protein [Streptomyces sp. SID3343]MYW02423.1 hypothetical protein [Streptomyces sp. SID3343]